MLTDKYLQGIPEGVARGAHPNSLLNREFLSGENLAKCGVGMRCRPRGQSLAQMALAWCLRDPRVTSGPERASAPDQLTHNVAALRQLSSPPRNSPRSTGTRPSPGSTAGLAPAGRVSN